MYQYDEKPNTTFTAETSTTLQKIRESEYAVLVGRNNCGKSFILKTLAQKFGVTASYLGPARYQNFNLLGSYAPNRGDRRHERFSQFMQQWGQQHQNTDNSPINVQQAIAELSDAQRDKLSEIMNMLLGVDLEIRQTVETNSMSQKYISVGGHNISYTSSGFRLITTLVTSLINTEYDTFLIDEPELGISPEAQGVFADFLFDRDHRAKYFPHIKTLLLATHSTIFLDRQRISNNYLVSKSGDVIDVVAAEDQRAFNNIHFFLLGNRLETLYLPSAIVLVEGRCDYEFIAKVANQQFPSTPLSVISAGSDTRIKEVLHLAKSLLYDIQKSPYRDRIFAVLDAVHGAGLPDQLVAMGLPAENIVVWSKNGIEYYYPPSVMDQIFGGGGDLVISGDVIVRNGIQHTKGELVRLVTDRLTPAVAMDAEFERLFLSRLRRCAAG
ncbi:MAG TPA: hypothetical protein VL358_06600 [Caulobacteraceae bacterium]|nr:hypothetical protein [Caulobacteraceae bacterium]